jgi:hypothetical protein
MKNSQVNDDDDDIEWVIRDPSPTPCKICVYCIYKYYIKMN